MTLFAFLVRRVAHVFFIASLAVTPAAVHAQQIVLVDARIAVPLSMPGDTAVASTNASGATPAGPLVQPVALRAVSAHALPTPAPIPAPRTGKPVAMIGVGIAAIIVGSIVGGDSGTIIAVTGAAIGLSGLYIYLR